jgi:hypothetical protein
MIYSVPFVIIFAHVAVALPQASVAPPTTPTAYPTTPYSSMGTNNSYSSTPSSYTTTGYSSQYTSSTYSSSSPYASGSSCPCNPPAYPPTSKKDPYSSGSSYNTSNCSCYSSTPYSSTPYSSTPYSSTPYSSTPYSSQPTYTSSSPYYPSKETYPPTPYPSPSPSYPGGKPPKTPSTFRTTFDTTFDNKAGSLNNVACSNGANGLVARFPTFGDIPKFPFIGGAFDVVWNSPNCGSCWNLTNAATGTSINIVAVDTAGSGFNIAQEAFVQLNGGQIGQGTVDVVASKVSPSICGL